VAEAVRRARKVIKHDAGPRSGPSVSGLIGSAGNLATTNRARELGAVA
jgi:hypothetical protein